MCYWLAIFKEFISLLIQPYCHTLNSWKKCKWTAQLYFTPQEVYKSILRQMATFLKRKWFVPCKELTGLFQMFVTFIGVSDQLKGSMIIYKETRLCYLATRIWIIECNITTFAHALFDCAQDKDKNVTRFEEQQSKQLIQSFKLHPDQNSLTTFRAHKGRKYTGANHWKSTTHFIHNLSTVIWDITLWS